MRDLLSRLANDHYADAVHGFNNPEYGNDKSTGVAYNATAAKRSLSI
jgi:hypothetical protein